jgi:AcrR family transcriptional regulator
MSTKIRRDQIARAALSLVSSRGLKRLSMAAVAREVGLVPSAIYRHFRNKGEVLDAIIDLVRGRLLANMEVVRKETAEPMERLRRLLMRHAMVIRENRGIPLVIFADDFHAGHPERRGKIYGAMRRYLAGVAQIVREGQAAGEVRRDVDPRTVSVMFLGMVQPAAILWYLSGGRFDVMGHARKAWRVLDHAIRAK